MAAEGASSKEGNFVRLRRALASQARLSRSEARYASTTGRNFLRMGVVTLIFIDAKRANFRGGTAPVKNFCGGTCLKCAP